jgi:tetratricopeptide (TPR) repeat protein
LLVLQHVEGRVLARDAGPVLARVRRPRTPADGDAWYRWACELEAEASGEAEEAYRRALAIDPDHGGAHLNLGRLLHERADPRAAEYHYRRALASRAHRATAAFNLGVALEDQGLVEEALLAYARALEGDRTLADAHFNASRLLERLGRREDALRHLAEYRRLSRR